IGKCIEKQKLEMNSGTGVLTMIGSKGDKNNSNSSNSNIHIIKNDDDNNEMDDDSNEDNDNSDNNSNSSNNSNNNKGGTEVSIGIHTNVKNNEEMDKKKRGNETSIELLKLSGQIFVSFWICGFAEEKMFSHKEFQFVWYLATLELIFFCVVTYIHEIIKYKEENVHLHSHSNSNYQTINNNNNSDNNNNNKNKEKKRKRKNIGMK
ncbi:RmlC-like cupin family protein, partial [Reticulomyxa filosa]